MARPKKITQNINKDAGFLDKPYVNVPDSQWESRHSNYTTCNIGDIVPIYVEECLPKEKRRITMGMLSHMTTPIYPIMNSQYTEFRCFWVPHRLSADLLGGYSTRKSPWNKVLGEDNASANADIVVPLANQKLPDVSQNLYSDWNTYLEAYGGVADALGYEFTDDSDGFEPSYFSSFNFMPYAAYELIYQTKYRNQNRESATNSQLYKWLFNIYNRTSVSVSYQYADAFHKANREKDYFTGSQPFTQKSNTPVTAGLVGNADVKLSATGTVGTGSSNNATMTTAISSSAMDSVGDSSNLSMTFGSGGNIATAKLIADLSSASGIDINQLRLMIKTQELLEKDMLFGNDMCSFLNAHFGTAPISLIIEEPLELKRITITSQMQPIFQTSTTSGEPTILGTIGANATTQSGDFEICPLTEFKEFGYLVICAVHKAQNSYDSLLYKPKHLFKKHRFDFYTPELNDLGYQPVSRKEFAVNNYQGSINEAVSYNEAFAEYRFGSFNKVHGMFEPSRNNSIRPWTLSCGGYSDIQSLYKQGVRELDEAISVKSNVSPQFYDAYGFIEYNDKPMSLHSIPGMDGVI